MVNVRLAGMNAPIRILEELKALKQDLEHTASSERTKLESAIQRTGELAEMFTPEVLAAAYARISRKPEDVNKLLEEAIHDVTEARKSNERIIYGMGHHSVADHALFNFNITDVSRLAVEDIEKRRIGVGYTEKSQRYITLDADLDDIIEPQEYSQDDLEKFKQLVQQQNSFYRYAFTKLYEHLQKKNSDKMQKLESKEKKDFLKSLEGSAKEDARFAVCQATKAQLGCSLDGEALEHTIRTLKYGRLKEDRELAKQLFEEAKNYAPSLIQLTDPEIFRQHNPGQELMDGNFEFTDPWLRELVHSQFNLPPLLRKLELVGYISYKLETRFRKDGRVTFVKSNNIDRNIIAALLHEYSDKSIEECYERACILAKNKLADYFVQQAFRCISAFDKTPRAFEVSNGMMFEVVISASGFAQLKRHRLMTLLSQDYNPELGITIPPNIEEVGLAGELKNIAELSAGQYSDFKPSYGKAAEYCLTNAHRRRTLVGINTRELYHVSRTREDKHAQWEIRGLVNSMSRLAKQAAPLTTLLLGGQDEFPNIYKEVYSVKK
ncbi:MAG TPA: FAD-dependent thymidylate synthase [Candidatus Nanoarchaeia archaeon]|nr:FAD-dependent thymidylate synthase [Candidatus Nanoarchaeia archaeon]